MDFDIVDIIVTIGLTLSMFITTEKDKNFKTV
jgi:hypothetical protein